MRTHASTHARVFKSQLRRVRAKKKRKKLVWQNNTRPKNKNSTQLVNDTYKLSQQAAEKHQTQINRYPKKNRSAKMPSKKALKIIIFSVNSVSTKKKPTTTTADDQEIWRRFARRRRHKHNHSGRVAKHSATKRPNDHPNTITVDHEREKISRNTHGAQSRK